MLQVTVKLICRRCRAVSDPRRPVRQFRDNSGRVVQSFYYCPRCRSATLHTETTLWPTSPPNRPNRPKI